MSDVHAIQESESRKKESRNSNEREEDRRSIDCDWRGGDCRET